MLATRMDIGLRAIFLSAFIRVPFVKLRTGIGGQMNPEGREIVRG